MRFLLQYQVKQVVIACNTATANALEVLERESPVPVVGAVLPGSQTAVAVTQNGNIGVLGTIGAISSKAYDKAITALLPTAKVTGLACPLLVPLAEEGWVDDEIAKMVVRRYLGQLQALNPIIDTIVLGCTHYPLLRDTISQVADELFAHKVHVVDSAVAMANAVKHLVGVRENTRQTAGKLSCFATDSSRLEELVTRFLGESASTFQIVDIV